MLRNVVVGPGGQLMVEDNPAVRATGTPTGSPLYTGGGLFGVCGVHPTLINAMVGPQGIEALLDWVASDETSPIYDALTHIGSSGHAQSGLCGDCGRPSFKECAQSACFGRFCQMTNEYSIDQLGQRRNIGVNRMAMFGPITDAAGQTLVAQGQQITDAFMLDLAGMGYNLRNILGTMIWTGNPVNNAGGYWEFPGMYQIINTGKFDVNTYADCDALDSYLYNFNNAVIGAAGSPSIVRFMTAQVRSVNYRVQGANMDSPEQYFIMHPVTWEGVADAWACEYGLTCASRADIQLNNDALALANKRDQILKSRRVLIDGVEYPVILDNMMPMTLRPYGNATSWCGNIVFITKRVMGETILWGEYQNLERSAASAMAFFRRVHNTNLIMTTDGGRFAIGGTTSGAWCFDARTLVKPRILCTMPWLQSRIQHVCHVPLGTYPDYTGSGGVYEREGGTSTKPYPGLYGDCGTREPSGYG